MDQLTSDLQRVAVHMDDLLVSWADARQHLQNLRALLQCLKDNKLQCNLDKCVFAQFPVEYQCHTLSWNGVSKRKKVDVVICMHDTSFGRLNPLFFLGLCTVLWHVHSKFGLTARPPQQATK